MKKKSVGGQPFCLAPIGLIHSEHRALEEIPIQPPYAKGCTGWIEIFPEYEEGLRDLEGFSHIYVLYHFHRAGPARLTVKPFLRDIERGLFATRAPCRPNAIGLSIVRLMRREGNLLYIEDVDILNGTPLLDIKPYTARFDRIETTRNGWQDEVDEKTASQQGKRAYHGSRHEFRMKVPITIAQRSSRLRSVLAVMSTSLRIRFAPEVVMPLKRRLESCQDLMEQVRED